MNNKEKTLPAFFRKGLYKKALAAVAVLALLGVLLYSASVAWFTNVAEIEGMAFETESWNFDGTVTVPDQAIRVSPGKNGCAQLSVTNESDVICELEVGVDKSSMSPQLQKRIYFYVPTQITTNEETVDRVYLSPYQGYTYTVMPKTTLLLDEEAAGDVPVYYEWTYDVLGYYVYGALALENGKYVLLENDLSDPPVYLRPLVYDYRKATFDDDTGELLTVDGTKTAREFLNETASKDGYAGLVSTDGFFGRYHPINVSSEANGRIVGLWMYLCTRQEIEEATAFDTRIGTYMYLAANEEAERIEADETQFADVRQLNYGVKMLITGRNTNLDTVEVPGAEALQDKITALSAGDSVALKLTGDATLSEPLTIPADTEVVLHLNGNHISLLDMRAKPVIEAAPGSKLTVMGGVIDGVEHNSAVYVAGGSAAFSDVSINGRLLVDDTDGRNEDDLTSVVRLSNCTLTGSTNQVGIQVFGNGDKNSRATTVIVENSTISSGYFGICGNGSSAYYGTNLQIINSTVEGGWTAIYQPQQKSSLVVKDSTLTGFTGLVIKGGTATVKNSIIRGTAAADDPDVNVLPTAEQLAKSNSGFIDTGAGIYVEANYGWADQISLIVRDSEVTSEANDRRILVLGPFAEQVSQEFENVSYQRSAQ